VCCNGCDQSFERGFSVVLTARLDRPNARPAVKAFGETLPASGKEVTSPTIEIDAVDEVASALRRLAEMFARRIIRITDRPVAILIINPELAPDISLARVDAFCFREVTEIFGSQKSGNDCRRPAIFCRVVACSSDCPVCEILLP